MTRHCRWAYSLLVVILGSFSQPALSQDVFGLLGSGAEARVHAGAGVLHSRGAPSNFYNPANLILTNGLESYFQLDIINLNYQYTYPEFETLEVARTTPVPFLGVSYRFGKRLAAGVSLLPLPGGTGETKILGLPTRRLTEDVPIVVNAVSEGNGFGWRFSMGGAYKVTNGFDLGVSLISVAGGAKTTVKDAQSDTDISETDVKTSSLAIKVGTRGHFLKGKIKTGFALSLPSKNSSEGSNTIPFLKDEDGNSASIDLTKESKGPLGIGLGVSFRMSQFVPFVEYNRNFWSSLRSQKGLAGTKEVEVDYFDTNSIVFGLDIGFKNVITGAIGIYQSHLGEGIIKDKSADDEELLGMEYQNLDAIPYMVFAGGYKLDLADLGYLQTGFSWLQGDREVSENAIGYGEYKLRVLSFIAGGAYRF